VEARGRGPGGAREGEREAEEACATPSTLSNCSRTPGLAQVDLSTDDASPRSPRPRSPLFYTQGERGEGEKKKREQLEDAR